MSEQSASEQIDDIIHMHGGWKGDFLSRIRAVITSADPEIVEEIKWRMKSRPEGLAVWTNGGIVCFVEIWKDNVKLLFPKGAHIKDPHKLFNARLESKDIRAIECKDGDKLDEEKLKQLIIEAVQLNIAG